MKRKKQSRGQLVMTRNVNAIQLITRTAALWLATMNSGWLRAGIIDFEDLPLLDSNTAIAESFTSGGASFAGNVVFDCCWSGWVYSNSTLNQAAAAATVASLETPLRVRRCSRQTLKE